MRIGMMLRCVDQKGGIGIYAQNLVREMLSIDQKNHYILFYNNGSNLGRFGHYDNVTERVVRAPNKAFWDQIAIPYACRKEKVDLIFHPKFTVPLFAPCKAVMVVHGADWFIHEHARFYNRLDVQYIKSVMPLYVKKASVVISVSRITTDNFIRILKVPEEKMKTVYFAPAKHFERIDDEVVLRKVKSRYSLPDKFIFTLCKYIPHGRGTVFSRPVRDDRKNVGEIFKAYARYHRQATSPHKLVIGGHGCEKFRDEYGIAEDSYAQDITFPGWMEQEDLPAVYSLADLFLYPSNVEAFPIPITEAMACGTPIITSNVNGLVEIVGDAALRVDPGDTQSIAEAMWRILSDESLQSTLSAKGLARSAKFSWDVCAKKTLAILESLGT